MASSGLIDRQCRQVLSSQADQVVYTFDLKEQPQDKVAEVPNEANAARQK